MSSPGKKMSGQFAQQLGQHALLVRVERRERCGGYPGRHSHRRFGSTPSAIGKRDGPAAAIFGIAECRHETAQMQAVDDTLDSRSIEIDQPAEIILRAGPNFVELGKRSELGLREPL